MSFILDALKKLEQKRQQDNVPHLTTIHTPDLHRPVKRPVWPYMLLAALVLNAGILLAWLGPWNAKSEDTVVQSTAVQDQETLITETVNKAPEVIKSETASAETLIKPDTINKPVPQLVSSKSEIAAATPAEKTNDISAKVQMEEQKPPLSEQPSDSSQLSSLELNPSVQELESLRSQIKEELAGAGIDNELPNVAPDKDDNKQVKEESAILELSELPLEIRKDIPDISIIGHIYSGHPSSRLVNINGSIVREGDTVSRSLKVKEITVSGVIFDYQGFHFKVRAF